MPLTVPCEYAAAHRMCRRPAAKCGYEYAVAHRAAAVLTGDYSDVFHLDDGSLAVFIGDATGHGAVAAVHASAMMAIFRTHPQLHGDPGHALKSANRLFHLVNQPDRFLTGVYVRLGERGRAWWASAGHDPPLHVRAAGAVEVADLRTVGFPLGIDPHEEYESAPTHLQTGDRLVLFTDGLVEVAGDDGEPFGRARLTRLAGELADRPLGEMVEQLIAQATACRQGQELEDDVTVLVVERVA